MDGHRWVALASALLAACGGGGEGGCSDAGGAEDAGTAPAPRSLSYTPDGCGYEVRTPEVAEAVRGGDAIGADPAPRFVHTSFAGPTSSSFAVSWRTGLDTTVTRVLYGTDADAVGAADGADEGSGVREAVGHAVLFDPFGAEPVRLHEAHVCGLEPGTDYYYKVGAPGAWSDVFDVATAPERGSTAPFRFVVAGDSRNDAATWAAVARAIGESGADFQMFTGDAVALGIHQRDWDAWFGASAGGVPVADTLARVPLMPANGNHDALAVNYVIQFALPQDESAGEQAQGEQWYSFDYGNAHFVVLDSNAGDDVIAGAQADWLEADLAAVDREVTPWVFAFHHHPPYSCSTRHGSDRVVREAWQPIYDRHRVDFVFTGHDHLYERGKPIRGFQAGSKAGALAEATAEGLPVDGSGTVYVVTGGAGAPLYGADDSCYHTQLTESVYHYVVIDIEGPTMRYAAYRLDGSVLDEFEITK